MFEEGVMAPLSLFAPGAEGDLAIDMYETEEAVVIKTAIPGVKAEDIDVSISGDTLTIRGETKEEQEIKRENYLRRERRFGSFSRSVTLPGDLEADEADADYADGILTLRLPKSEEVRAKSIKVKAE
jgi:HSP20 family protein